MSVLKFVENFNNFDFSFLKKKADITFLKPYKDKKILMVGYQKYETEIDSILDFDIEKLKLLLDKYNLFVISYRINYQTRKKIKDIIKLFNQNKKNFIFLGYKSVINLNLDNSKNMFRPIDLRKDPFDIKNYKVLSSGPYYYYLIQYILLIIFSIYLNIKFDKFLYKILILIVILFALFIPFKNILYISNNE